MEIAKILSQNFNCLSPKNGKACGKCKICVGIDSGLLPIWKGVNSIHYYTIEEIKNIVNDVCYHNSSKIISPYSTTKIFLSAYSKNHSYWNNQIHLAFSSDSNNEENILCIKNNKMGRSVITEYIWNTLKKIYAKDLHVDIESLKKIS
ncbi:hypothetical protein [Clostridium cochlearium]|uniref:hypothetical protein n=1 Tax=Clostridium cochlearium TaxID=1494 RepID=UPI0017AC9FAF|nr:hypothetical protein [Clostridium cochlearium]NMA58626.1 hypothetical protein [Clostridium cochlearium]